jgi:hypothetical protein
MGKLLGAARAICQEQGPGDQEMEQADGTTAGARWEVSQNLNQVEATVKLLREQLERAEAVIRAAEKLMGADWECQPEMNALHDALAAYRAGDSRVMDDLKAFKEALKTRPLKNTSEGEG